MAQRFDDPAAFFDLGLSFRVTEVLAAFAAAPVRAVPGFRTRRGNRCVRLQIVVVRPLGIQGDVGCYSRIEVVCVRQILIAIPAGKGEATFFCRRLFRFRCFSSILYRLRSDLAAAVCIERDGVSCRFRNSRKLGRVGRGTGHGWECFFRTIYSRTTVRRPPTEGIGVKLSFASCRSSAGVSRNFTFRVFCRIVIDTIAYKLNDVFKIVHRCLFKQTNLSSVVSCRI